MSSIYYTKPRKVTAARYDKNKPSELTGFVPTSHRRFNEGMATFEILIDGNRWAPVFDGEWVVMYMDYGDYEVFGNEYFHTHFNQADKSEQR